MSKTGLKIVLSDSVTDTTLRKLDHYYGITFQVGVSNQGGDNGYKSLIGNDDLRSEMKFHNLFKPCIVKDGVIVEEIDSTKFSSYTLDGSDGSDVLWCATQDIYSIDGAQLDGEEIRAISDSPFSYNGIVATKHAAFGECIDFATLKDGILRSIRDDSLNGTQTGGWGTNYTDSQYNTNGSANAGGYPRTSLSKWDYEKYARARNTDTNTNYPYAPVNNIDRELLETLLMIEFRTKNIENLISNSITSATAPTADTWGKVTGIRMTSDSGASYTYGRLNTSVYLNGSTTLQNMWYICNGSSPLLKIFEPQIKVSNGDTLESVYDSDGNVIQSLSANVMTGIWTKTFSFEFNGSLTSGDTPVTYLVDVCLRVPIYRGRQIFGGISKWYSGYEAVRWLDESGFTHHQIFRAPSIDKLVINYDTTENTESGLFSFESVYNDCGELPAIAITSSMYAKERLYDENSFVSVPFVKETGATKNTYENIINWTNLHTVIGTYDNYGIMFGSYADDTAGMFNMAYLHALPTSTGTVRGGGFRVALNV